MFRKFKVMKKKKELKSKGAYPTFKNSNKKKDRGWETYFTPCFFVLSMGTESEYYPTKTLNRHTVFKNIKGVGLYQRKIG
tara:strand:- start:2845 stop:3084 length:240 start_codon:yes stop_codon:yes gene_type:complete